MYRDDRCAVCGESLPPDHFYCRAHGAEVDARLHELGRLLPQITADITHLAALFDQIAPETWDYLAEQETDDPVWPPAPPVVLRADADQVSVDPDDEPGLVRVELQVALSVLLGAVGQGLDHPGLVRLARAATVAEGANATH